MKRRDFIKNSAAVIATAALLPAVIKPESKVTYDIETQEPLQLRGFFGGIEIGDHITVTTWEGQADYTVIEVTGPVMGLKPNHAHT
jgi:hypothetical protein